MATTYCTTQEVKDEFKDLDTTSAGVAVTTAKIDGFRDQQFAVINGRIGNKYSTPVASSATQAFAILKMIETWMVKARVQGVTGVSTASDKAKQNESPKDLEKKASDMLDMICAGKLRLEGATLLQTGDGVSSFNVDEGVEHVVQKDEDQW